MRQRVGVTRRTGVKLKHRAGKLHGLTNTNRRRCAGKYQNRVGGCGIAVTGGALQEKAVVGKLGHHAAGCNRLAKQRTGAARTLNCTDWRYRRVVVGNADILGGRAQRYSRGRVTDRQDSRFRAFGSVIVNHIKGNRSARTTAGYGNHRITQSVIAGGNIGATDC